MNDQFKHYKSKVPSETPKLVLFNFCCGFAHGIVARMLCGCWHIHLRSFQE